MGRGSLHPHLALAQTRTLQEGLGTLRPNRQLHRTLCQKIHHRGLSQAVCQFPCLHMASCRRREGDRVRGRKEVDRTITVPSPNPRGEPSIKTQLSGWAQWGTPLIPALSNKQRQAGLCRFEDHPSLCNEFKDSQTLSEKAIHVHMHTYMHTHSHGCSGAARHLEIWLSLCLRAECQSKPWHKACASTLRASASCRKWEK